VDPDVDTELPDLPEAVGAMRTLVRTLTRMESYMGVQIALLGEGSRTVGALVRTLARMNTHMGLQVYLMHEGLIAIETNKEIASLFDLALL